MPGIGKGFDVNTVLTPVCAYAAVLAAFRRTTFCVSNVILD